MKKRLQIAIIISSVALLSSLNIGEVAAQKKLKIGDTEILLQSPVQITADKDKVVTQESNDNNKTSKKRRQTYYSRSFTDFYFGMGLATDYPTRDKIFPVVYGDSYDLQVGFKEFYRPCSFYAIGTQIQYSYFSYRLIDSSNTDLNFPVPGVIQREYFKTHNVGTAFINRLYFTSNFRLEFGAYADYTFLKQYVAKSSLVPDKTEKFKFEDNTLFNPIQVGLQASIGGRSFSIYAKYRITTWFNKHIISPDPPRLHLGVQLSF